MILIRNVECFTPEPLGRRDVLIAGGSIIAITEARGSSPETSAADVMAVDGTNHRLIPGIVDALTHPCGGGGEGGFANRTPEIPAEAFIRAGITTPVAALGTDSLGRSLDVLYGNVKGLQGHGLGALMMTGAYRCPAPTITGDVARDIYFIDPVIGVGEVAVADHRGSQPTVDELRRLGAEAALGGILAGRGGTVLVHVGDGSSHLDLLEAAIDQSDLQPQVFYPTHVNRSTALLDAAVRWTHRGGYVDITVSTTPELIAAGDIPAADALRYLLDNGAPAGQITLSSDAGGSLPLYVEGVLKGLTAASPSVMASLLIDLLASDPELFPCALAAMTGNPAAALNLPDRGSITVGGRADLALIPTDGDQISHVMSQGKWLMADGELLAPSP